MSDFKLGRKTKPTLKGRNAPRAYLYNPEKTLKPKGKPTRTRTEPLKPTMRAASGGKMKKKPVTKAFMGLLTASPSLKFMRDKGI
ncbi:MAG: hypothetical protein CML17_00970, partial [Pusillimonas sp.]|nr:hypothetical protein [Pusillimonas sp.]